MPGTPVVWLHAPPRLLQWSRMFPGTPEYLWPAREFVRYLLADTPIVADATLTASELATNTMRHSRTGQLGGTFIVTIRRWSEGGAAVSVTDNGDRVSLCTGGPLRAEATNTSGDPLSEHGRGLDIVRAITRSLSVHGTARGRTYTAEFSW